MFEHNFQVHNHKYVFLTPILRIETPKSLQNIYKITEV